MKRKNVAVIGGCGHVGLPLGLALADRGYNVHLVDINPDAVEQINAGKLPFKEEGAEQLLKRYANRELKATLDPEILRSQDIVVFVTGTPVDEHLNPRVQDVLNVILSYTKYLSPNQLIVLRSTVFPGVAEIVQHLLEKELGKAKVAFCPERIVQGKGIEEIFELPQIISGTTEEVS